MIRETLFKSRRGSLSGFRFRGDDIKRIETFSDGVFAFAVTLLIVSLEVPKTFEELLISMRGFIAFSICFLLLMLVWHEQHSFFRRYALDDKTSIVLNAALLFIVLFYVYPLKFVFSLLFADQIYGAHTNPFSITEGQVRQLMVIYGFGYIAIYSIFLLLYVHAYRKKALLELNILEMFDTRTKIWSHLILVSIGFCAVVLALVVPARVVGNTGWFYMLIMPSFWVYFHRRYILRRRLVTLSDAVL